MTISVHPSAARTPDAFDDGLPARFLFSAPGQAELWVAYARAHAPPLIDASFGALIDEAFDATLDATPSVETFVSLGAGDGYKDARLVEMARDRGRTLRYLAVDGSRALVEAAIANVGGGDGLVADMLALEGREALPADRGPRIVACLAVIPNHDADALFRTLGDLTGPGDTLLFSANLSPGPRRVAEARILPQYDNPEARAWYDGALPALGIHDAEITIDAVDDVESGERYHVRVTAECPQPIEIDGRALGPRIHVLRSNRYTDAQIRRDLVAAGFAIEAAHVHPSREEGLYRLTRR